MDKATLKLTTPHMHGSAVRRLQEMCDDLGFDRGPNDGIFGKNTRDAVIDVQRHLGISADGKCGTVTWAAIINALDAKTSNKEEERFEIGTPGIFDIRGKHPRPKNYAYQRDWRTIDGVVIHQTGCEMPLSPSKWGRLNAHIGITRNGDVVLVNDFTDIIYHAQGLSAASIGIEIAGNFQGVNGVERTLWSGGGGPHYLTPGQISGLEKVFTLVCGEFSSNGSKWKYVNVHRQSSPSRLADPGSEIYQAVVIPWMERLEATDGGPEFFKGKGDRAGKPVPIEWNPAYHHHY